MASVAILVADLGLLAWGAMAALAPEHLLGPGLAPILAAGYEGFTHQPWQQLMDVSPRAPEFITMVFRMFGAYIIAFCVMAIGVAAWPFRRGERWAWWALLAGNTIAFLVPMTYDWIVDAIGPFEMTEYLGIALIYAALAFTAPFAGIGREEGTTDYSRRKPADRLV
jgi:hypothetical protein